MFCEEREGDGSEQRWYLVGGAQRFTNGIADGCMESAFTSTVGSCDEAEELVAWTARVFESMLVLGMNLMCRRRKEPSCVYPRGALEAQKGFVGPVCDCGNNELELSSPRL